MRCPEVSQRHWEAMRIASQIPNVSELQQSVSNEDRIQISRKKEKQLKRKAELSVKVAAKLQFSMTAVILKTCVKPTGVRNKVFSITSCTLINAVVVVISSILVT